MADITFWKDEYQKFIDGVLCEEQRQFLEKADLIGQEIAYLEKKGLTSLVVTPKLLCSFCILTTI